ncbi:MAG: hypothetical protein QM579_10850 [Desulfovibrio sp.]
MHAIDSQQPPIAPNGADCNWGHAKYLFQLRNIYSGYMSWYCGNITVHALETEKKTSRIKHGSATDLQNKQKTFCGKIAHNHTGKGTRLPVGAVKKLACPTGLFGIHKIQKRFPNQSTFRQTQYFFFL